MPNPLFHEAGCGSRGGGHAGPTMAKQQVICAVVQNISAQLRGMEPVRPPSLCKTVGSTSKSAHTLTDLLTRRCGTGETRHTAGDGFELAALVGGTYRL